MSETLSKLELVISESGVDHEHALTISTAMNPFFAQAAEWQAKIPSVTDPKVARTSRLVLRGIRVEAKHEKDKLKETVLKVGRAVDGAYRAIEDTITPMETALEAVEKKAEREEAEYKAKVRAEREAKLAPYGVNTTFFQLAEMPEDNFAQLLESSKIAHETKQAAAAKAEQDRIAREKKEAEEREKTRLENERLKREAFEEAKRVEQERAEVAAKEAALRKEREAVEEAARKQKAELEAKARAEREAREKAEAELANARAAEAAKLAAEEAARKKAARAPDRDKIKALASKIAAIELPTATSPEGKAVLLQIEEQFGKMVLWLNKKAGEL